MHSLIGELWFNKLSVREQNEILQLNVGTEFIPVSTNNGEQMGEQQPGQATPCLLVQEEVKGLSNRMATMNGDIFGHDGRGGLFKDLDEIKEYCRRTETEVKTITQELIADRTRNEGRFEQIEKDINNIGDKVRLVKNEVDEIKKEDVGQDKAKYEETKAFWMGIVQKLIMLVIGAAVAMIFPYLFGA